MVGMPGNPSPPARGWADVTLPSSPLLPHHHCLGQELCSTSSPPRTIPVKSLLLSGAAFWVPHTVTTKQLSKFCSPHPPTPPLFKPKQDCSRRNIICKKQNV